ncbi:MAG: short chain dehydrogenase [Saprospiraceae bacterium]|nr:MAG: short chain dehydrogenase [Saprospiraceae bacterium]
MEFEDKVILITGSGSGIGQVTAHLFAKEGGTVVVADINEKGGHETVKQITAAGGKSSFINVDVADYASVENLINKVIQQFGRLDIAVNNAGVLGDLARTAETSLDTWNKVMAVNASGVFYCLKLEIQQMLKQGAGIIVNTASIAGLRGLPNNLAYTASKHAVVGMTKTAAMEYARYHIRINAVCPVFTTTPMFDPKAINQISAGLSDKLKASVPMKRFANPVEIAHTIVWLCSEKASFITGHAIPIDGGLTA